MRPPSLSGGLLVTAAIALAGGCESHYPDPLPGRIIRGALRYGGQVHARYERPGLQVVALATVPPMGQPHAVLSIERPDFSRPVPYELRHMHPFRYKVVARLIDFAHPMPSDTSVPTGGYPDFCTFVTAPQGNVEVTDTGPTTGIDFALYDHGGADDPCGKSTDVCPKAGAGTLQATLLLDRPKAAIVPPDQLVFALLTEPTAFPTRFRLELAAGLAEKGFPFEIVINDVPPGAYIVYGCYDVDGDNLMGCGPRDFSAMLDDTMKLSIAAGKITRLRMDLGGKAVALTGVDEASARGCP